MDCWAQRLVPEAPSHQPGTVRWPRQGSEAICGASSQSFDGLPGGLRGMSSRNHQNWGRNSEEWKEYPLIISNSYGKKYWIILKVVIWTGNIWQKWCCKPLEPIFTPFEAIFPCLPLCISRWFPNASLAAHHLRFLENYMVIDSWLHCKLPKLNPVGFWPCDLNCLRNTAHSGDSGPKEMQSDGSCCANFEAQIDSAVHQWRSFHSPCFPGLLPMQHLEIWQLQTKMTKKWKSNSECPESALKKKTPPDFLSCLPKTPTSGAEALSLRKRWPAQSAHSSKSAKSKHPKKWPSGNSSFSQ